MGLIRQLSREDVMFVAGETDAVYQHVSALTILDHSDKPDFDFEYFRQHCINRIPHIPQFRWKLYSVPMGLDRPYWVEDKHFNFDHHIKHIALPKPGDHAALCEVAAHLYSKHLDRNRPLWEIWLIEGLEDGKFAYMQKFHHCMMDGEGALKLLGAICDLEPNPAPNRQVDKGISEIAGGEAPTTQQRSAKAWQHWSSLPGDAAKSMYDILRPKFLEQFVWPRKPKEKRPVVPTACFNGEISSDRALSFVSLSLAEIKAVKNYFQVSLNDVVLALVSSSIRSYLIDHADLPRESLRTNIPVSLRTQNDDQLSNKVTNTTVTLATQLKDPIKRLKAIHQESEQAKAMAHTGGVGIIEIFQMMPPILVSTLMESLPAEQAPQILGANLIVSNIHGSPLPLYIAGARIEALYPMSILTAGIGINVTCISYQDAMDFGVIVDPHLVPEYSTIADKLEDALAEYLALCKPASRPKKKAATRNKKPAAKAGKAATVKKAAAKSKPTPKPKPKPKPKKTVAKKSTAKQKR